MGVAIAVRGWYLLELKGSPFFSVPIVDEVTYLGQAERIADGELTGGEEPFWQPPLYTYFLALVRRAFGRNFLVLRGASLALGVLACLLAYRLGSKVFGRKVGTLAGVMVAVCGSSIFFEGMLLPTALGTVLGLASVEAMLRAREWTGWTLAGASLGTATLAVGHFLGLVPFVVLWMLIWGGRSTGRLGLSGAFLGGLVAVVLPVTIRNWLVGKEFVVISSNVGVNFYVGNNPEYERTVSLRSGTEWWSLTTQPGKAGLERMSERSGYFLRKGLDFVRSHPFKYLALLGRKMYIFWRGEEVKRNQDVYAYSRFTPIMKVLLWRKVLCFPFGLLGPLSLVGLGLALVYRRDPKVVLLALIVLGFFLSVVLFFPCGRYRVPLIPVLSVFGAYGLVWGYERAKEGGVRGLVLPCCAFSAMVLAFNWGPKGPNPRDEAESHFLLAYAYAQIGMTASALAEAHRAVMLDPNYVEPHELLGTLSANRGALEDAVKEFRKVIELYPEHLEARMNLANVLLQQGRYDEAAEEFRELLRYGSPDSAAVYQGLGIALLKAGNPREAISAYEEAVRMDPSRPEALFGLAVAHTELGDRDEAERLYREVLERKPNHAEAWNNLGVMLMQEGKRDEAISMLRKAVEADPQYLGAWYNLATAYIEAKEYGRALRACNRILELDPTYKDGEVLRDVAMLYRKVGDVGRAKEMMERYHDYKTREQLKRVVQEFLR